MVAASAARAEPEALCGPFAGPKYATADAATDANDVTAKARLLAMNEAGTAAASGAASDAASEAMRPRQPEKGHIVGLPDADPRAEAPNRPSEALLALPKDAGGAIPGGFQLGTGARIAQSYFSPVICSTVARVEGPPGAGLDQLVTVVPDGAIVVDNTVYASASAEVEALELPAAKVEPTPDPYAPLQYGLAATGVREVRGLADGSGVRVALLDSMPEADHRDLGEVELRAIEGSGDAINRTGVHGTLMAGVIRAVEDNGFGIAGVAPGAELVSIPICAPGSGSGGRCTIWELLKGLDLAWDAEVQIVNLSLSGPPNPLLERGVDRLYELGVVVVAAAGNEGASIPRFPAAYSSVLGVGAIDRDGVVFERSNRGSWVELLAPGVEILSTVPGSAFAFGSGTSLAAAHVTGLLAVLTGVTKEPKLARAELFRAAHSRSGSSATNVARLPAACEVIVRLGLDCAQDTDLLGKARATDGAASNAASLSTRQGKRAPDAESAAANR